MRKKRFTLRIKDYSLHDPVRKKYYNEQLFSEVAPRYDFITRALSLGRDRAWKRGMLRLLPARADARCLDIACGTGEITRLLARRYPGGRVTGIDLNRDMLARARRSTSLPNIDFTRADMCRTGFPSATFDILTGGYALRNAPSLDRALEEFHRILKPGGAAVFLDFAKSPVRLPRFFQLRLLRMWGDLWGLLAHGKPEVYGYIAESLKAFPDHRALRALLAEKKYKRIEIKLLFGGMMSLVRVEK